MKRKVILASLLATIFAVPAFAGTQDNAVMALHSTVKATKDTQRCSTLDPVNANIGCENFVVTNPLLTGRDVYLVVAKADEVAGIAGLSLGISYDGALGSGIDMSSWTLCSSLDFPNGGWPASGGGNRITWSAGTACQRTIPAGSPNGAHAVAGAFYVYAYSSDTFKITENKGLQIPELRVADCSASESSVNQAKGVGSAGFGANGGCNPCLVDCGIIPVERTTWGQIKTLSN